jgi:hypothetical protein
LLTPPAQDARGQSVCTACRSGSFADLLGQAACKLCAIGTFGADAGQSACAACPAGKYTDVAGASACQQCNSATGFASGATSCTTCAPGRYIGQENGASACVACAPGSFQVCGPLAGAVAAEFGRSAGPSGAVGVPGVPAWFLHRRQRSLCVQGVLAGPVRLGHGPERLHALRGGAVRQRDELGAVQRVPVGPVQLGDGRQRLRRLRAWQVRGRSQLSEHERHRRFCMRAVRGRALSGMADRLVCPRHRR